jgi:hypothetical protein
VGVPYFLSWALKTFRRDFAGPEREPDDGFILQESGRLSYEDARALYRRLSGYFAKKGTGTKQEMRKRGKRGAAKRWGTGGTN